MKRNRKINRGTVFLRKIKLLDVNTPLAQALLGHRVGDEIEFKVNKKIQKVVILGIK